MSQIRSRSRTLHAIVLLSLAALPVGSVGTRAHAKERVEKLLRSSARPATASRASPNRSSRSEDPT